MTQADTERLTVAINNLEMQIQELRREIETLNGYLANQRSNEHQP